MFLTPVILPLEKLVGEKYRELLYLNPMTGIIEGFRWSFLGGAPGMVFPGEALAVSAGAIVVVLAVGQWYFRRVERTFADIV
jgi:lipopolysaccharide transport system permease protein